IAATRRPISCDVISYIPSDDTAWTMHYWVTRNTHAMGDSTDSRSAVLLRGYRRRLPQAEQVGQKLVRAVGSRRQLAPQPKAEINPPSCADLPLHQRAELLSWIVLERVGHGQQIHVPFILLPQKVQTTFLYPSTPGGRSDLIRVVEHRVIRHEQLDWNRLVADAVPANLGGIRAIILPVEFHLVVFQMRDTLSNEIVPKGLLMMGIPGCGKSLSVKAIATCFQLPLYSVDMVEIFSDRK